MTAPKVLTVEELKTKFGLDCGGGLEWKNWFPGGEFVKSLHIKNISQKTHHIKYELPSTKYFGMDFPTGKELSPGLAWILSVTFRPIEFHEYDDTIKITTDTGCFLLPVKAAIPGLGVSVPKQLEFDYSPVKEISEQQFEIQNDGELDFIFSWQVLKPFTIKPMYGKLAKNKTQTFTISFFPEEAGVWKSEAVITISNDKKELKKEVKINGIAKYPFITAQSSDITFGDVLTGRTVVKDLVLQNPTNVKTFFRIQRLENGDEAAFGMSHLSGVVPSKGSTHIQVHFSPLCSGVFSTDTFNILTPGGNKLTVRCYGRAVGTQVTFSETVIDFGSNPIDTPITKLLIVYNQSADPAVLQFTSEHRSIFSIDNIKHSECTIGPNSSVELKITFRPTSPINFYRRIFCLVKNEVIQYLDLLGTAFDESRRPPDMNYHHILVSRKRKSRGLARLPPETLESVHQDEEIFDDSVKELMSAEFLFNEFLADNHRTDEIQLSENYIDFGPSSRKFPSEPKYISFVNRTQGKVTCSWIIPGKPGQSAFSVQPPVADVVPNEEFQFKIIFQPNQDNQFYGQSLECYVYYKTMRNFRLINEQTLTAPWCLTTYVAGHTFPPGEETFLPNASLQVKKLKFPSAHINDSVFQTIALTNNGDTPARFHIQSDTPNRIFSFKPNRGVLQANEKQLIVFKFSPLETKQYRQTLRCVMNNSAANTLYLELIGFGDIPSILLENKGTLYLKPTCVGTSTMREYEILNSSRILSNFQIDVPNKYINLIEFSPNEGTLYSNEKALITCIFNPTKQREYDFIIPLTIKSLPISNGVKPLDTILPITAIGEGTSGLITLEPPLISFESVLIGASVAKEMTVVNRSNCHVQYLLSFRYQVKTDQSETKKSEVNFNDADLFQLSSTTGSNLNIVLSVLGVIPAHGSQTVVATFTPGSHSFYSFIISCKITMDATMSSTPRASQRPTTSQIIESSNIPTCEVIGFGVYPSVTVVDARSDAFSSAFVWKMFQIDALNQRLHSDLTLTEEKVTNFKGLLISNEYVEELEPYFLHFGVSPSTLISLFFAHKQVGGKTSTYLFMLHNDGGIQADFSFSFLSKLEIAKENWVQVTIKGEYEQRQAFIIENQLFSVHPENGTLQPGETCTIRITYKHSFVDKHETDVLFQLRNGKPLKFRFKGETIDTITSHLSFYPEDFVFKPVPIGVEHAPIQTYEILNDSAQFVEYKVDLNALKKLSVDNYDFEVLTCENPTGTIPPKQSFSLKFQFNPIEDKMYRVEIPISYGNQISKIKLSGRGYNPMFKTYEEMSSSIQKFNYPTIQRCIFKGQLGSVSRERIQFGTVPIRFRKSQVVIVKNVSIASISYEWQMSERANLRAFPAKGMLSPGEQAICKINFTAPSIPQYHEFDISILFTNETDKTKEDEEDKEDDFFSDAGSTASGVSGVTGRIKLKPELSFKRPKKRRNSYPMRKYSHFLTIEAEVQSDSQYLQQHKDFGQFFRPFQSESSPKVEEIPKGSLDILSEIIDDVIHEIIREPEIELTLNSLKNEKAPYFAQMIQTCHPVSEEVQYQTNRDLFCLSDFQETIEDTFDQVISNILQEAVYGEFDLLTPPKQAKPLLEQHPTASNSKNKRRVTFGQK